MKRLTTLILIGAFVALFAGLALASNPCTMPNCTCDCHAATQPTTAPALPANTTLLDSLDRLDRTKPGPTIQLEARTYTFSGPWIRLPPGTKLLGIPGKTIFAAAPGYVQSTKDRGLFALDWTPNVTITDVDYRAGDSKTYLIWASHTDRLTLRARLLNKCGLLHGSQVTNSTIEGEALTDVGEYGIQIGGGNGITFKNLKILHGAVWHCIRLWNVSNSTMDNVQLDPGTGWNPLKWHNGANNVINNCIFTGRTKIGPLPDAENGTDGTPVTALLVTDTTFRGQVKLEAGVIAAQFKRCTITTSDTGPCIATSVADPVLHTSPATAFIENVKGTTAVGGKFASGPGKLTVGLGNTFNLKPLAPTSQPSTQP
jgi:hypothetical protein